MVAAETSKVSHQGLVSDRGAWLAA